MNKLNVRNMDFIDTKLEVFLQLLDGTISINFEFEDQYLLFKNEINSIIMADGLL